MPVEIGWLVKNRVIGSYYYGDVTPEDIEQAADKIAHLINSCDTPEVHSIIDTTNIRHFPRDINILRRVTHKSLSHPRRGWLIIYGRDDTMIRVATRFTVSIFKVRLRMFAEREEAVRYLKSVDSSLADVELGCDVCCPSQ